MHDLVAQAQARFLNAQADMMTTGISGNQQPKKSPLPPFDKGGCEHSERGDFSCGCKVTTGHKETQRPTPWPELDKVEADYEGDLKARWEDLRQRIFTVMKLTDGDIAMGMTRSAEIPPIPPLSKGGDRSGTKEEGFSFTEEQRAQVLNSLEDFIGEYAPGPAGPATWYYGQSYSLGLIQAARMIGQERPILDIIKNREIFDELVKSGFQLVKDNATAAIKNRIMAEMQAHVLAGSNPLSVASRLQKLFGDQNSAWERLARTEMSMSAEQAKVNEWKEWGVNIKKAIIAGRDTHPRCRCANTVQQIDGEWFLKFSPAPDACALCFSLAV